MKYRCHRALSIILAAALIFSLPGAVYASEEVPAVSEEENGVAAEQAAAPAAAEQDTQTAAEQAVAPAAAEQAVAQATAEQAVAQAAAEQTTAPAETPDIASDADSPAASEEAADPEESAGDAEAGDDAEEEEIALDELAADEPAEGDVPADGVEEDDLFDDSAVIEPEEAPLMKAAAKFAYTGDTLAVITADGSGFGMFAPQDGSGVIRSNGQVLVTLFPKNTTVYAGFYLGGDITDQSTWKDYKELRTSGSFGFSVDENDCGYAWPIAPVKPDMTSTTSKQYYLALPAKDKIPEKTDTVKEFSYDGDEFTLIDKDGGAFGMLAPQEGSKAVLTGDQVKITLNPKNTTIYAGFYLGADIEDDSTWDSGSYYAADSAGSYSITLSKSYCGYAWPIAPVKVKDMTATTARQYYLAIPAADKLEEEKEHVKEFAYDKDTFTFIDKDGGGFGMFAPQDGSKAVLSGRQVKITFYPKNTTVYAGFYPEADITDSETWDDDTFIAADDNGNYSFTLDKKYCGYAWPIAPVKVKDRTATTSKQYYMAIPAEDKLEKDSDSDDPDTPDDPDPQDPDDPEPETPDDPGEGALTVVKYPKMFPIAAASLKNIGGKKFLVVNMGGSGAYSKFFKGTKEDAAVSKESARLASVEVKAGGKKQWQFTIPVTNEGTFAVAALSKNNNSWYDRTFILDQKAKTLSVEAPDPATSVPVPDGEDRRGQSGGDDSKGKDSGKTPDSSNVNPGTVNNATTLSDGTYGPDQFKFSFSGGTGKVVIVCTQVVVRNGQAFATIKFQKPDGRPSSVDMVRASGSTYAGNNVFDIPVRLNTNNTVVGRTTAMSQPHWIEYQIFIGMAEPGARTGSALNSSGKEMDKEAPEILGIAVKGEVEVVYSDRIKIFEYEDGIYLVEVNMTADTAREDMEEEDKADEDGDAGDRSEEIGSDDRGQAAVDPDQADNGSYSNAEEEAAPVESEASITAKLYLNDIVKYLVVPEETEIPAGLGKEVIVIRQPTDRTYVSSAGALELLVDLGLIDMITMIGLEEEEITVDAVLEAMGGDGTDKTAEETIQSLITYAGPYNKWDLRKMIRGRTNFVIQSSAFLPKDEKTLEKDMKNFERLTNRSAQMGLACFVDRSEDEENNLARAEWYKVYGIIFGEADKAEAAYDKVVKAASASEKKAALALLEKRAKEREQKD